jgi:Kinase/pyrophosphorylase
VARRHALRISSIQSIFLVFHYFFVRQGNAKNEANEESQSTYADRNCLLKDLHNARKLAEAYNWTEIDVTGRAVEETATVIVELFNERFHERVSPNSLR